MVDQYDTEPKNRSKDPLNPLNLLDNPKNSIAIAIRDACEDSDIPEVVAVGRGKIAENILQLAFANNIKVRQDKALVNILASVELDSPIPTEAFMAVAEILSYVYRANNERDPFDAVLDDGIDRT